MSDWADPHADQLLIRVASGLTLGGLGVAAAVAGGPWLAAAAAAAVTAMSFEWVRMSEPAPRGLAWATAAIGALAAVMAASWGRFEVSVAALALAALVSFMRRAGGGAVRAQAAFGVAYIGLAPAALVAIRGEPGLGLIAVLGLFTVIWAADIAAYFGGRFIGGPRLAPSLSPRKTWAGVICGALAAGVAGSAFGAQIGATATGWALAGLVLGVIGLAGDLFESLCKRRFGVKDASGLIPGHGGVLDRLDSLIFATLSLGLLAAVAPALTAQLFPAAA
jgi:phosphatidate cytidylyltransferase